MSTIRAKISKLTLPTIGIFIILMPIIFSETTIDPVLMPRFILLSSVLLCLLGILLFTKQTLMAKPVIQSGWFWAYIAFIMFSFLSGINAVNKAEFLYSVSFQVILLIYTMVLISAIQSNQNAIEIVTRSLVIAGLIISGIAIYQILQNQLDLAPNHDQLHLVKSTLGHKNLLASGLLILLPFTIYHSIVNSGNWRWIGIVGTVLSIALIVYIQARSAYLGTLVGLVFFALSGLLARLPKRFMNAMALGIVIGLSAWFTFQYMNYSSEDAHQIAFQIEEDNERTFTIYERELLWNGTLNMAFNQSYLGVGSGNWKIEFPKYGSEIWRARQGLVQFQRPHNDFLWALSETGIAGAVSYILTFLFMLILGLQNLMNKALEKNDRLLNKLLVGGLVAYVVVANFSFPKERVFHQVVLHSYFALITVINLRQLKKTASPSYLVLVSMALSTLCIVIGVARYKGEHFSKSLMALRANNEWQKTIADHAEHKKSPFYTIDPMAMPIDFYAGLALLESGESKRSLEVFNKAKTAHPNNVHVLNNLGSNHQLLGNLDSATYYYTRVVGMAPYYRDGILNLAAVEFNNGFIDEAYDVLRAFETKFEDDRDRYERYLAVILNTILLNLAEEQPSTEVEQRLSQHNGDNVWLMNCHQSAVLDSISIESVMIINANEIAN